MVTFYASPIRNDASSDIGSNALFSNKEIIPTRKEMRRAWDTSEANYSLPKKMIKSETNKEFKASIEMHSWTYYITNLRLPLLRWWKAQFMNFCGSDT